ncbi:MAG: diaminopimelate decarboxylase [Clostridiales bacterium]|jgi:diaminopimelate decarboxylase|nr:diaminopimelate decarboxylase [Clostridiales bacterium]
MKSIMDCLNYDDFGNLEIDSIKVSDISQKFETPLYIMSEKKIRENCRKYIKASKKFFGNKFQILYASKAFSCKHMYKIINEENLGTDVVSEGELFTALSSDFPTEKIYFHGNNKSYNELKMAVEKNVGKIIVDNIRELTLLNEISKEMKKITNILIRIKPGVEAHTHEFIKTGVIDSKFGNDINSKECEEIIKNTRNMQNIKLIGLHCHIGSQIFSHEPFELACEIMLKFIAKIKKEYNIKINELNLGGGFGVKYIKNDLNIQYENFIEKISNKIFEVCEKFNVEHPKILLEPGRSIVANSGITVYTVGSIKNIPNVRKYVLVDGGMNDNPRYIMYGAKYEIIPVKTSFKKTQEKVTVAGKCCESGDIISKNILIEPVKINDQIAVLCTGAYNFSMASNYNRIPRLPVVMVSNGQLKLIVKRETLEDITKNDL